MKAGLRATTIRKLFATAELAVRRIDAQIQMRQ
jgi:hypothetical protein